jgi:hypothetical protein
MTTANKQNDSVHRLLDIVVEEVSLVDRAANKRRFLIVKRSNPMEENRSDNLSNPDGQQACAEKQAPDEEQAPAASDTEESPPDGTMLEAAVQALERLTETVEALGALGDGDTRLKIGEIAAELRALADRLAQAAGIEPVPAPETSTESGDLALVIESVRATLQQVGSLIDATKAAPQKAKPKAEALEADDTEKDKADKRDPTTENTSARPSQEDVLGKNLAGLADSVKKLAETTKEQAQRLSKLEKSFGLPNCAPAEQSRPNAGKTEVNWPLDLNRPLDRQSVDKSLSFHD